MTPTSQNIVVETPNPQPQQNLGPILPQVYQLQEYPSQEIVENNPNPSRNQNIPSIDNINNNQKSFSKFE